MSTSTHKSLVRVLLWWVAVLSISQVVLLVLFLTMGHFGQAGVPSDKARMFTFQAKGVHSNRSITLYSVDSQDLPTDEGQLGILNIKKDGYFCMCLRITLEECNTSEHKATEVDRVDLLKNNEPILYGWINNNTCSTGLLCKMEKLAIGNTLRVEIQTRRDLSTIRVNNSLTVSYLDVLYMPNKYVSERSSASVYSSTSRD